MDCSLAEKSAAQRASPGASPARKPASPPRVRRVRRAVSFAERWRTGARSSDAKGEVKRFYDAIKAPAEMDTDGQDEAKEALHALRDAAQLFALAASPPDGLFGLVLGTKYEVEPEVLEALGADADERERTVDKGLFLTLRRAVREPSAAREVLARVPNQIRKLMALRFFALSGFDFCLAAENLQDGLGQVLSDDLLEEWDGDSSDRNNSVDAFGVAMDVLGKTLPSAEIFQDTLRAALERRGSPPAWVQAVEEMTDEDVCPDLSWLMELEDPDESEDEEDEEEDE